MWAVTRVVLACQVLNGESTLLRSRLHHEDHAAHATALNHSSLRTDMLKVMPPFDMNAGNFLSLVAAVPTDSLLLFFSPTCPDCEKLAPQWSRVTEYFENNQDLTILSVSDDAGAAPAPYIHDENPTVFFIPKGGASKPIMFAMSDLHEFVALPETGNTDDAMVNKLVTFTRNHLTNAPSADLPVALPVATSQVATPAQAFNEAESGQLTARLLMSLKTKEAYPLEEQLKIVYEPQYQTLPVVEFLKSPSGMIGPPLFIVAATYMDGLPLAQKWAAQFAAQQEATYRKQGWNPSPAEEQSYTQGLLKYALPLYARSIYFQRGLKR